MQMLVPQQEFLRYIHLARSCCSPRSVLQDDLRPFKFQISEELMDAATQRGVGTHYQIIGHKLYREKNCMFPAR